MRALRDIGFGRGSLPALVERLRQRVDDLLRELTGLPSPEPELVPVPVRVRVRRPEVDRT